MTLNGRVNKKTFDRVLCPDCKLYFWRNKKGKSRKGKSLPVGVVGSNCKKCWKCGRKQKGLRKLIEDKN